MSARQARRHSRRGTRVSSRAALDALDKIEGREDAAFLAAVGRSDADERQNLTAFVSADVGYAPARPAYADDVGLRNLHRMSVARLQLLPVPENPRTGTSMIFVSRADACRNVAMPVPRLYSGSATKR